jgi:hypothetical protein
MSNVIKDYQLGLDKNCDGRHDRNCMWEVYETNESGQRWRGIAIFTTLEEALVYTGIPMRGYTGIRQIRVYKTAQEVQDAEIRDQRKTALAKLTEAERQLLGLS